VRPRRTQPKVNVADPAIQSFGKYQILERIATGGTAEIYKARLEGIGGFQRTFAIKRILPNLSQNSEYIAMLVDEAKVAGLLSHANIVQILDLGQVDGIWYIAMEYVHGRDLGGVLRAAHSQSVPLPVPHTVFIAIELLKGLEYAHQRQVMRGGQPVALHIIHRDVSPQNVLMSFQGEVKLTDFGIARASMKVMDTATGGVQGRFDYMSPEQAIGELELDQRSDLFSVGVVLYEMLTGHHPFRVDNDMETVERVRAGEYVPVSQHNTDVPFTLETIVDRALRVDRSERYPSATAFKEALDKFFHDAGFIFTHATLASYVRSLYPESSPRGTRSGPGPTSGSPHVGVAPVLQVPGNQAHGPGAPPPNIAAVHVPLPTVGGLRPSPLAAFLNEDDQETFIKRTEGSWEDEVATQLRSQNNVPDETLAPSAGADTLPEVDESPTKEKVMGKLAGQPTITPLEAGQDAEEGNTPTPSSELSVPSPAVREPREPSRKARQRATRTRQNALLGVLMLLTLFIGLTFGALSTALGLRLMGFQSVATDAPLNREPLIQVIAPETARITLDGAPAGQDIPVEPGREVVVEVTLEGHLPWRAEFSLRRGEHRVLIVTSAAAVAVVEP